MLRRLRKLAVCNEGTALTETIVVLPVVMMFSFAVIEFGSFLAAKSRVEAGVRDAARFLARCRDDSTICNVAAARNVAAYGAIVPNGNLRVHGWRDPSGCNLTGPPDPCIAVTPSPFLPVEGAKIRVETDFNWDGSALLTALGLTVPIRTFHEDVYIGD